jgi:hypothetical protein
MLSSWRRPGPLGEPPHRVRDRNDRRGIFAGTGTTATIADSRSCALPSSIRSSRPARPQRHRRLIGRSQASSFRSLTAAVMTAVPAMLSGLVIAGGLGAIGVPISVMTNVIPCW